MKKNRHKILYLFPVLLFFLLSSVEDNPLANEIRLLLMGFFFSAVFIFLYLPVLFLLIAEHQSYRWYDVR